MDEKNPTVSLLRMASLTPDETVCNIGSGPETLLSRKYLNGNTHTTTTNSDNLHRRNSSTNHNDEPPKKKPYQNVPSMDLQQISDFPTQIPTNEEWNDKLIMESVDSSHVDSDQTAAATGSSDSATSFVSDFEEICHDSQHESGSKDHVISSSPQQTVISSSSQQLQVVIDLM